MITLVGSNALAPRVHDLLRERLPPGMVVRGEDGAATGPDGLVVVIGGSRSIREWEQAGRRTGARVLPFHVGWDGAIVGPLLAPGSAGCFECWHSRWRAARPASWNLRVVEPLNARGDGGEDVPPWGREVAAQLIAGRAMWHHQNRTTAGDPWTFYRLDLTTLAGREHRLLPDPCCPRCSTSATDSPELARVDLTPRPKKSPGDYRLRELHGLEPRLTSLYLDEAAGVVQSLSNLLGYRRVAVAGAEMNIEGATTAELGVGRTMRYSTSRTAALLEALERYAGHRPRARKTAVRGTYRSLAEPALDPESLGLHSPLEYSLNPRSLVPYTPELEMDFVWGHSFARGRPILVPEQVVYYFAQLWSKEPRFVYEISSGCALGSCPEEAIFHGILEVVERDAFLLTWYARMPPGRIELDDSVSPELRARLRALDDAGYDVHLLDIRTEVDVPAVWALALNRHGRAPGSVSAAGAHPDPREAIGAAVAELAITLEAQEQQGENPRARAMLEDPFQLREMADHAALYALPEAVDRLAFLREGKTVTLAEMSERASELRTDDLAEDLRRLIARFTARGMDVIAVDQTPPEQRASGFCTYKTIIPGTIPITFGHHRRRLVGLPRLHTVPAELYGRVGGELNPHPHPFP